jgi:hypothetical protein
VGPLGGTASHLLGLYWFDGGGDIGSKEAVLPLGPAVEGTLKYATPGQAFLLSETLLLKMRGISLAASVLESIGLICWLHLLQLGLVLLALLIDGSQHLKDRGEFEGCFGIGDWGQDESIAVLLLVAVHHYIIMWLLLLQRTKGKGSKSVHYYRQDWRNNTA